MSSDFYSLLDAADCLAEWEQVHHPPPIVKRAVYDWIDGLYDDPWQDPAQHVERDHPHDQAIALAAEIPETWVEIRYTVDETHMVVRVLDVGPIPEGERTY